MKMSRLSRTLGAAVASLAATVAVSSLRAEAPAGNAITSSSGGTVTAITKPSEQVRHAFQTMGVVKEALVKDGDPVKLGQPLMALDADLDQKEMERLKVEAESNSRIEAQEKDLEVKTMAYNRKAKAPGAFTVEDIDQTRLEKIASEKQLEVAKDEKHQALIKYEAAKMRVEKAVLPSKIDGIVQQVVVRPGEAVDPQRQEGAVVVVKNDPLWVEIPDLTTLQVSMLKVGDKLGVRYENDGDNGKVEQAEVIFITPMANAGADTQTVRLSLPNPQGRASGLHMIVKLPQKLIDATSKGESAAMAPSH